MDTSSTPTPIMIPTKEQIDLVSGAVALLIEDFSGAAYEAGEAVAKSADDEVTEAELARNLAESLRRGSRGAELQKLLRGAREVMDLWHTAL